MTTGSEEHNRIYMYAHLCLLHSGRSHHRTKGQRTLATPKNLRVHIDFMTTSMELMGCQTPVGYLDSCAWPQSTRKYTTQYLAVHWFLRQLNPNIQALRPMQKSSNMQQTLLMKESYQSAQNELQCDANVKEPNKSPR